MYVITSTGIKDVDNLVLTDKLASADGNFYRIRSLKKKKVKLYRVYFSDGTFIHLPEDSKLKVLNLYQPQKKFHLKPLEDIKKKLYNPGKNYKLYRVAKCKPINFSSKILPVEPYTLGVLLGDGCLVNSSICLAIGDLDIKNRVARRLPSSLKINYVAGVSWNIVKHKGVGKLNPLKEEIIKLGLNILGYFKFIPDIYKYADAKQRLEILRGLLDTDGSTMCGSAFRFCSTSRQLIKDIRWLIYSLGGSSTVTKEWHTLSTHWAYIVSLRLPKHIVPFHCIRKKKMMTDRQYTVNRLIADIKYTGKKSHTCIRTKSPDGSYVTSKGIILYA